RIINTHQTSYASLQTCCLWHELKSAIGHTDPYRLTFPLSSNPSTCCSFKLLGISNLRASPLNHLKVINFNTTNNLRRLPLATSSTPTFATDVRSNPASE